ncbi:MAG: diguanylate cyclase [Rubrivivax sp.]|nr:diguanylate cyclase [Rubrivivax sp.]
MNALTDPVAAAALPAHAEADAEAWAGWGAVLAAAGQGAAVKEAASGRYVHANTVLLAWLGRDAAGVAGHTDAELFDAASHAALRAADQAALAQGEAMSADHRLNFGAQVRDVAVCRIGVGRADGAAGGRPEGARWLLSVWTDTSPLRQQEAQSRAMLAQIEQMQAANDALRRELADQALRDAASGLYTRAHFEDQLRREADLSSREHREFAIVFIEVDEAPADGSTASAATTGAVHAALGRLLRSGTRAMDAACRLDERRFAVLLSGVGLATAHSRMEGLRRRCATEIVVHQGRELRFTAAMGVASFPHTANTQAELVQACSEALREAQRRGGNHVALAAIRLEAA